MVSWSCCRREAVYTGDENANSRTKMYASCKSLLLTLQVKLLLHVSSGHWRRERKQQNKGVQDQDSFRKDLQIAFLEFRLQPTWHHATEDRAPCPDEETSASITHSLFDRMTHTGDRVTTCDTVQTSVSITYSPSPDAVTMARSWPSRGVGSKAWRTPFDPGK